MEKIMLFSGATIKETFDDFMLSRKTKGLIKITFKRCVKLFFEFLPLFILNDISRGEMFLIFEKS